MPTGSPRSHRSSCLPLTGGRVHTLATGVTLVDDSYNASPLAMKRLLEMLAMAPGRRVAVLGEMYELGDGTADAHSTIGEIAAASCDLLIATGGASAEELSVAARAFGMTRENVHRVGDAEAALDLLNTLLQPGDVVLIKGSRGVGLDRTVDALLGQEAA